MMQIEGLHEISKLPQTVETLHDAMEHYPKMEKTFPSKRVRLNALAATLWFYVAYDMYWGKAYSLDEDINEAVLILESKYMNYSWRRCFKAGCYSLEYQKAKEKLSVDDRKRRIGLFKELDKLEKKIPLPKKYLYVDFLGVKQSAQSEGRGSKLMQKVCEYADEQELPIMLFTNDRKAEKFYNRLGFSEIGKTTSKKFGFENTYLLRNPQ